jgi:hypothetical protein
MIDHRGIMLNFPLGTLAHLGLARAHALQGDTPKPAPPTPTSPSCSRPRGSTRSCSDLAPLGSSLLVVVNRRSRNLRLAPDTVQF